MTPKWILKDLNLALNSTFFEKKKKKKRENQIGEKLSVAMKHIWI